jgi:hypothetical protein
MAAKGNEEQLMPILGKIKEGTLKRMDDLKSVESSEIVLSKIGVVSEAVRSLDPSDTSSENVSKFLVLGKLCEEISGEGNE